MCSVIKTIKFKQVILVMLLCLFTFVGTNAFAAEKQGLEDSQTLYTESSGTSATGFVASFLSLFSPKDACAASDIDSCKDYCNDWYVLGGCCVKGSWQVSTMPSGTGCRQTWTCPDE